MVKVPCKVTPLGDKDYARNFIGAGQSQLRILEEEMKARGLVQGVRRTRLDPRTTAEATITHQFQEVKIYSQPIKKEVEELGAEPVEKKRFFAKVRRGGIYGEINFYWILFTEEDEIKIIPANSSRDLLNRMSAVPYTVTRNTHAFTKSFMIENENDKEERWIAAPHLLIKESCFEKEKIYTEMFNPLGYPYAQSNLTGEEFRYYPLPPLCSGSPLQHSCPPNRFYCNTDERKMVWYSCYTVLDETIPSAPVLVHYCFGIILTLTDDMISETYYSPAGSEYHRITDPGTDRELIKTFNCCSSEADTEGFDPLWYYEKPDPVCTPPNPDPMCGADADIPYQMLIDVNSLDEKALEVFIPWSERPLKITVDLTGPSFGTVESDHAYEEVTETQHWYWTEEGFEQEIFSSLEQTSIPGGIVSYTDVSVDTPHSGCACTPPIECELGDSTICCNQTTGLTPSGEDCETAQLRIEADVMDGCGAHDGKFRETFKGQWQRIWWREPLAGTSHRYSLYELYLPDKTLSMESNDREVVTIQGKFTEAQYCHGDWANMGAVKIPDEPWGVWYWKWQLTCILLDATSIGGCIRYIGETLKNKLVDGATADWCSPNVIFVGAEKDRLYVDGFEETGKYNLSWSTVTGSNVQYDGSHYAQVSGVAAFADSYWGEPGGGYSACSHGWPDLAFINYDGYGVWGAPIDSEVFAVTTSITDYALDSFSAASIDPQYNRKRYCDRNTLSEPLVLEYQVDGEGSFGSVDHNRTYYLDDRSSYDSEGLISAARGAICVDYTVEGYPVFEVASWSVVYKKPETDSFMLITDKLLEALDCNASELIELGLV